MAVRIRLSTLPGQDPGELRFTLAWAAPAEAEEVPCMPARLDYGDGTAVDLGLLCPPTAVTWHEQRQFDLGLHRYAGPGPYTAHLRWGDAVAEAFAAPGARAALRSPGRAPVVVLFALAPVAGQPLQRLAKLRVEGLASGQRLRLDGGAAQVRWLSEVSGGAQAAEFLLDYAKPGPYRVTLDALDADGFWLATLAESPLELAFPEQARVAAEPAAPFQQETPAAPSTTEALAEPQPWLPYRYVKPIRYGIHTYASPGGGAVRRSVNPGIYLSVRAETAAAGDRWFRTAEDDWIAASAVTFFRTSELRGVVLDGTPVPPPPPPPPPPPTEARHGIVTSATLNVRGRPGVSADNPPVATLAAGAAVTIYEERTVAGAAWYRIGESRWVHSGYVRLVSAPEPPPPPPPAGAHRGVVTATTLNVRARPGIAAGNPSVAAAARRRRGHRVRDTNGRGGCVVSHRRWTLGHQHLGAAA